MTDPLAKLFGSSARVKILRLFLFNPRNSFACADVVVRARITDRDARRELVTLLATGVITRSARGKGVRYVLNPGFMYLKELQNLLLNPQVRGEEISKNLSKVGAIKMVILAGVFMGEWEAQLDVLLVGDRIKERGLRDQMRRLESELGRELRYTRLSTADFLYRYNMSDKLIRDVLDYPHRVTLDKLQIGIR